MTKEEALKINELFKQIDGLKNANENLRGQIALLQTQSGSSQQILQALDSLSEKIDAYGSKLDEIAATASKIPAKKSVRS